MADELKTALLVVACLGLSGLAWRVRQFNREHALTGWRRRLAAGGGLAVGLAGAIVMWPFDDGLRIMGIPFPAVFLQRSSTGVWQDFLGITTGPFLCLDAVIGGTLGYGLVVWMAQR